MFFIERFKKLRENNNFSNAQISRLLEVSESAVYRISKGLRKPSFNTIIKLSEIFGVTLDYLVGRSDFTTEIKTENIIYKDVFLTRLSYLVEKKQLTTYSLADKLKLKQSSVFNLIKGINNPCFDTLIKLADIFDVSLDYLVGRTDNPDVNK